MKSAHLTLTYISLLHAALLPCRNQAYLHAHTDSPPHTKAPQFVRSTAAAKRSTDKSSAVHTPLPSDSLLNLIFFFLWGTLYIAGICPAIYSIYNQLGMEGNSCRSREETAHRETTRAIISEGDVRCVLENEHLQPLHIH